MLWVGVQGDLAPLLKLQTGLENSLTAKGFPKETRPFAPHITLARVRGKFSLTDIQHLAAAVESARAQPKRELPVHLLSLMESILTAHGTLYTRRGRISLQPILAQ